MSLIHALSSVPKTALDDMYNKSLFDETSDQTLIGSSMAFELKLARHDDRAGSITRHILPRIYLGTLKNLYEKASKEFSIPTCVRISELYRVGLGIPLDARLSSFWKCFAFGNKPDYGGNEVEYADILYALKHHIKAAIKQSPDGHISYLHHLQKHFDKYTSMFSVKDSNIENSIKKHKSKKVFAGPNVIGRDATLVYRRHSTAEGYKLYAAFFESKGKFVPCLKQASDCESIPKRLSEGMPNIGTFVVIVGKIVLNNKSVKELTQHREERTADELLNAWVDQDIFSHRDCVKNQTSEQVGAVKYLNEIKATLQQAKNLVTKIDMMDAENKRVKKVNRAKYKKAKAYIEAADVYSKIVKDRRKEVTAWNKNADISPHAKFYGFDMFVDDTLNGTRMIRASFLNIQKQFKRIGILAIPFVEMKVGAINTLTRRASADVRRVKGAPHDGVIIRTCDNRTVKQTIESLWYKL